MIIGILKKQADGALFGDLPTMNLRGVSFEPVESKGKGPNFRASIEGAELGAGWMKKTSEGKDYVSAKIDAPQFPAPVYVAIFKTREDDTYAVAFNRPRREATPEASDEASDEPAF